MNFAFAAEPAIPGGLIVYRAPALHAFGFAEDGAAYEAPRRFRGNKRRRPGTVEAATAEAFAALGVEAAAALVGLRPSRVYEFADPDARARLPVAYALAWTSPASPAFAELFAHQAGGLFAPLDPPIATPAELAEAFAHAQGEATRALVALLARADARARADLIAATARVARAAVALRGALS